MKILAIGDPHIRRHAEFSRATDDGLTEHLHAIQHSLEWLCDLVETEQPLYVVCLGDVHDSPDGVDAQSMAVAAHGWAQLAEMCAAVGAELHFLVGNHDRYNGFVHTLDHYSWLGAHVHVHAEPTELDWHGKRVLMLPWAAHRAVPPESPAGLCFSHQELVGATVWGTRREEAGVNPELLAGVVVQGHYHIPHEFGNVVCPGSLVAKSFQDLEEHDSPGRGAVLLSWPHEHDRPTAWELQPNPHSPKFVDFYLPRDTDALLELTDDDRIRARVYYPQDEAEMASALVGAMAGRARMIAQEATAAVARALPVGVDVEDPTAVVRAYGAAQGVAEDLLAAGLGVVTQAVAATSGARVLLRPTRVVCRNFFSWENVDLQLPAQGLVLVTGNNGEGKTTLITEPVLWALTGDTTARQDVRADTVCRLTDPTDPDSGIEKPTVVEVHMVCELTGREIVVIRRRHPSDEAKLELIIDGENVAGHRQPASQAQIDGETRLDATGLLASNFLVQAFSQAFSTLAPGARLAYFEQILRLDVYEKARDAAKARHAEARRARDRIAGEQTAADRALEAAKTRRDITLPDELTAAERRLDDAQKSIADRVAQATAQVAVERAAVAEQAKVATSARAKADKLKPHVQTWERRLREESTRASNLLYEVKSLDGRIEEVTRLLDAGQCPTCGQATEDCAVDQLMSLSDQRAERHAEWQTAAASVRDLDAKYQRVRDSWQDAEGDERRALRTQADAQRRLTGAEAHVQALKGGLRELEAEIGRCRTRIQEAEGAVVRAQTQSDESYAALAEADEVLAQWQYWVDAFGGGGLRLDVLGRALAEVNDRLATLSADMLDFGVALDNDGGSRGRSGLAVHLLGTSKTLGHLSSGQRRALDFVIQLALADMAMRRAPGALKLLVADEVLDTLDPGNLSRVIDALEHMSHDRLVLVTAHNPSMRALIPDRWDVRMTDERISEVEIQ